MTIDKYKPRLALSTLQDRNYIQCLTMHQWHHSQIIITQCTNLLLTQCIDKVQDKQLHYLY